jgi:hypothetical protein
VIPKLHNLGFCFLATASTHKEFSGLMFAPQTIPASPAVLMCRSLKKRILKFVLILGVDCPLPYPHFPGLPIFLRRQYNWASLVRLSESIVTGGSVTIHILTQSRLRKTGFLPIFSMIPLTVNSSLLRTLALDPARL